MGGTLPSAWCTPTVNPLTTDDPTPALSGSVNASTATVTARVAGVYYAATNNNGHGPCRKATSSPVWPGTYDVAVFAVQRLWTDGIRTTSPMSLRSSARPVASIPAAVPNARNTTVNSVAIHFNEPVNGFGLQDLQLTLNGLSMPLGGATLTTSDNQNWTLGNLAGLTAAQGPYTLTLTCRRLGNRRSVRQSVDGQCHRHLGHGHDAADGRPDRSPRRRFNAATPAAAPPV